MPRITIGSPPGLPPTTPDNPATPAARAAEAAAIASGAASATDQSRPHHTHPPEEGASRTSLFNRELWLVLLLASVVPMIAALIAPPSATVILFGVAAIFIVAGIVLYFRGRSQPRADG